ncbi:succinyldiaminopimelate transaminase [Parvibium lacunae]|uniref:Succinyldiaminopimelate transaminase n=1 Tax=Parvibium lacunae TaxID=1888893 RepID=A0A368L8N8_9BURK|nr:succinyldiaminopimelate transaminase [Parvibium lacunae]RCS59922.1 succinyldiaminopimelate transaminase [Parvibium lacunae]
MNPDLAALHPYPFEKLRQLFAGVTPNPNYAPINLSIGEPKHPTPALIKAALTDHLNGLASYPTTLGSDALRSAIAAWLRRRYGLVDINPATQILPVNGSREALFSFAQCVLDRQQPAPLVLCPNPFYQIYEGAALLGGAQPYYLQTTAAQGWRVDYASIPEEIWQRTQLVFVCSPGNPTGAVMPLDDWALLFNKADQYGFVIAADECYSEIYFRADAPLGGLQAAQQLGRHDYRQLLMFTSLSKRSNVPGLRSGFVAGDANLIKPYLLYRTYHGCAMSPTVQAASIAAWNDETHVIDNREQYRKKFSAVTPRLAEVLNVQLPDAAFYLWAGLPAQFGLDDTQFARQLLEQYNVTVLPGSYLARDVNGTNPGQNYIRIALVAEATECETAAERIVDFIKTLKTS